LPRDTSVAFSKAGYLPVQWLLGYASNGNTSHLLQSTDTLVQSEIRDLFLLV